MMLPGGAIRLRSTRRRDGVVSVYMYDGRRRIGHIRAAKWFNLSACRSDVEALEAMGYIPQATYVVHQSEVDDAHRNLGLGKRLYRDLFARLAELEGGTVFVGPESCWIGTGTSRDAERVWTSLAREYPSSGFVLAVEPLERKNPGDLPYVETTEDGIRFATGEPVEFNFVRNTERSPYLGALYQQDIEPAGRYLLHRGADKFDPPRGWETGTVKFESPLVLALNTDPNAASIYDESSWKAHLQRAYGATGAALSSKLRKAGYDGIVTVTLDEHGRPMDTREIVDLRAKRRRARNPGARHWERIARKIAG